MVNNTPYSYSERRAYYMEYRKYMSEGPPSEATSTKGSDIFNFQKAPTAPWHACLHRLYPQTGRKTSMSPSPSPPPPDPDPEIFKHCHYWDLVLRAFFIKSGLTQTLKGFEDDMLVFNPEREKLKIPLALEEMIKGLTDVTVGFFLDFQKNLELTDMDIVGCF